MTFITVLGCIIGAAVLIVAFSTPAYTPESAAPAPTIYRITLYSGGQVVRTWETENRPAMYRSHATFDGTRITGTWVVEPIVEEPASE
jgi:hypothetical protein